MIGTKSAARWMVGETKGRVKKNWKLGWVTQRITAALICQNNNSQMEG